MRRRQDRVTLHEKAALVECAEEGLLDELLLLPEFRAALLRLLPPRHALLDPDRVADLLPRLRERGIPPRLVS
jgi:hypothetical protein